MRTVAEYESWLAEQTDPALLRQEALERMRVNAGLLAENEELKRRIRHLEEGGNAGRQFSRAVEERAAELLRGIDLTSDSRRAI